MLRNIITTSTVFFSMLIFSANSAQAGGNDWKAKMIADALTAAPPAVTNDATIYAWDKKGQMILLRPGSGPYVCLVSFSKNQTLITLYMHMMQINYI